MAKRRTRDEETSTYIDWNLSLGSVAEVERVFSFAKYVLCDNRRCMTPQLFEALMFLKDHRLVTWPTEFGMMILSKKSSSDTSMRQT